MSPTDTRFMNNSKSPYPPLKWAGGKRKLAQTIIEKIPLDTNTYREPFLGGGGVTVALLNTHPNLPKILSDINKEAILTFSLIQNRLEDLIQELKTHENTKSHFYEIRSWDRQDSWDNLCPVKKAARFIYLNRTCYNGLCRTNSRGQLNAPYGHYKRPKICDENNLSILSRLLSEQNIRFNCEDFETAIDNASSGDFIYCDPPYDPIKKDSFVRYSGKFDRMEQERLKAALDRASDRGVKFLLSNSSTEFIHELYAEYDIQVFLASRSIACKSQSRTPAQEVFISNLG